VEKPALLAQALDRELEPLRRDDLAEDATGRDGLAILDVDRGAA